MRDNRFTIILSLLAIVIFLSIGFAVRGSDEGILFDVKIIEYVHSKTTSTGVSIMKIVSYFGSAKFFIPIGVVIFLFMIKDKNIYGIKLLVLSTLGSYAFNEVLKSIFFRTRPLEYFLIEQGGFSYPSGHSMVSMTFYTTMAYLFLKRTKDKRIRKIIWGLNFIIIGVIGFSRIYLVVHWPTDILAGYIIGYLFYCISKSLVRSS